MAELPEGSLLSSPTASYLRQAAEIPVSLVPVTRVILESVLGSGRLGENPLCVTPIIFVLRLLSFPVSCELPCASCTSTGAGSCPKHTVHLGMLCFVNQTCELRQPDGPLASPVADSQNLLLSALQRLPLTR
jgi:hypothetical protein